VLEAISKGEIASDADWDRAFETLWQREIAVQEQETQSRSSTQHMGSASYWPHYAIRRARVKHVAHQLWFARTTAASHLQSTHVQHTQSISVEHQYVAFNGRMTGVADVVRHEDNRVIIEDYKTGSLLSIDTETGQTRLREAYRQQVLFYAAMHYNTTGHWATLGRLIPLEGDPVEVEIIPEEALALVQQVLYALETYNNLILSGASIDQIAQPSDEHCRWCPYQLFCNPFWDYIQPKTEWLYDIAECTIAEIIRQDSDNTVCRIQVVRGTLEIGIYHLHVPYSTHVERLVTARGRSFRVSHLKRSGSRLETTVTSLIWYAGIEEE
jgi:RecB family exonuclease